MKRFFSLFAIALTAILLVGCATPTYYQASGTDKRIWGYAERQVDGPLFRVSYTDTFNAGTERTYAYAMFRAAELAQEKGATHFEVLEGLLNRDMLERFIARPVASSDEAFHYKQTASTVFDIDNQRWLANGQSLDTGALPALKVQGQRLQFYAPTYIYVPVQPPPPPQQVSLLIRLLSAPSLDPAKGFNVQELLTRLGPKVLRSPTRSSI